MMLLFHQSLDSRTIKHQETQLAASVLFVKLIELICTQAKIAGGAASITACLFLRSRYIHFSDMIFPMTSVSLMTQSPVNSR